MSPIPGTAGLCEWTTCKGRTGLRSAPAGSGTGQFSNPEGIWVDSSGRIYVADTGNSRIVQITDITGAGFIALGTAGSGTNQFNGPTAVTTDAAGNIYIADGGNSRLVEVADMSGTNWTILQFALGYLTPAGIAVDSSGRIYTTDALQSQFIRVDNMTGANAIYLYINYTNFADGPKVPPVFLQTHFFLRSMAALLRA